MTAGLHIAQRFPGASTCIVFGDCGDSTSAILDGHRAILWCLDTSANLPALAPAHRSRVELLPLDTPAKALAPALEKFVRRDLRHLPSFFVGASVLTDRSANFLDVIGQVQAALDGHHRARVTLLLAGGTWQRHLFGNLPAYLERRIPAAWQGALQGVPAFVCGAGPSLDVSAGPLAAHAARGVVFAADSALRALHRHGIQVDFAVSIDAAKRPEKCLPPDGPPARVVLAPTSPPSWVGAADRVPCYFLSSGQVTLDWLAAQGVARTGLAARENCGNTALELARFLGCAPIYLFGLDLALDASAPARRHNASADPTVYRHSGFDAEQKHPHVPGNYAESVPTFAPRDWRSLDDRLAGWPAGLVVNVNDRGARFRNTTLIHPASFTSVPGHADKLAALTRLPGVSPAGPADRAALQRLATLCQRAARHTGALQTALRTRGPGAAADIFRAIFAERETGAAFGAFAFKLMPHLLPPTEGTPAEWLAYVEEFAQLADAGACLAHPAAPATAPCV